MSPLAWVFAVLAAGLLVLSGVLAVRLRAARSRVSHDLLAGEEHTSLQARAADLQRSNAELEQFAYLASHDLQEPLRKVASFCQLLQRRYAGKLDARADQYIEFAVDGAKRMQALINDLLAFSRVGQTAIQPALVSSDTALARARTNLAEEIEKSGATIEAGHLPLVLAELPLLTAVFQNLLSNAVKFSGPAPPRIVISATRHSGAAGGDGSPPRGVRGDGSPQPGGLGDSFPQKREAGHRGVGPRGKYWLFSFTDYGIGIDPQHAERVFGLFERLNERSAYPGTGVGLAMCRKIIEYFGGRIWLDTTAESTRFCFTLRGDEDDD